MYQTFAQRLSQIQTLSMSAGESQDKRMMLARIVEVAIDFLGGEGGCLYFAYPESQELEAYIERGPFGNRHQGARLAYGEGAAGWVAKEGKPLLVDDYAIWPFRSSKFGPPSQYRSLISAPLVRDSRLEGVLQVYSTQTPNFFTEDDLNLLCIFANQASLVLHSATLLENEHRQRLLAEKLALENARLYEQAESERRNINVLYAIGHQITASLEPDEILQRAIQLTTQSLEGHFGLAYRYLPEKDTLSLRAVWGDFPTTIEDYNRTTHWSGDRGFIGWVMKNRRADLIQDVSQDERWWHHAGYDEEVRSAIVAPILFEDQFYGILGIMHRELGAFDEADLNLMKAICQQLGLALSNAERYQEAQHRLRQVTLLQKLTQSFLRHLDLQELLQTVVDELTTNFHYPIIEIFLRKGDSLQLRAWNGDSVILHQIPLNRGVIGRAVRSGQNQVVIDVSQDPDYLPDNPQTVSEFVMPILLHGEVVGVLNIETDRNIALKQTDVDFFQLLADQIAIAIENATLYENMRHYADQLEEAVIRRTAELSELYELSQEIGCALTNQDLMQIILSHLCTAVKCDFTVGCLLTNHASTLYVNSKRPLTEETLSALRKHCQNELIQVFGNGTTIAAIEVSLAEHGQEAEPIRAFQAISRYPIVLADQIVGVLGIGDEKVEVFNDEHLRLLKTFANQASIALQRLESMREAEKKRLSNLVENLPIGILLINSEHQILVMNPIANQLLEAMQAKVEGNILYSLGTKKIDELLAQPTDILPLELIVEEPSRRIFEAQANPIGEPPTQWVITLREVTIEREIQTRVQMQERLATVGQLAAGIAHDFNNILAAILVYADLMRNDLSLSSACQDRLAIIQQQVHRAASLIHQILDFSRRSIMEQTTLDLLPFIKEFEKMLSRILPETIRVEFRYQPQNYFVLADPTRLQQMLMNLSLNARDAMPHGGVLRISLARLSLKENEEKPALFIQPGEWIVIEVRDTGHGIDAKHLPHIFEPFFTTKPVGSGTGLGLAQVYGIVKQHGGYIDVQSQPSVGTTFTVYLPALLQPSKDITDEQPSPLIDGKGKTALVVEDDPATRNALKALLEAQHYQTLTAADGSEALGLWETYREKIELLISDIVMPRLGGVELFNALKAKQPDIKVLFITGHPLGEEYRAALESGQIHWLQKPFSIAELNRAIRTLLEQLG